MLFKILLPLTLTLLASALVTPQTPVKNCSTTITAKSINYLGTNGAYLLRVHIALATKLLQRTNVFLSMLRPSE